MGGCSSSAAPVPTLPLATAEIFDPATGHVHGHRIALDAACD